MPLIVPPVTAIARRLLHRQRLAGQHRLVHRRAPSSTTPSTGTFSPGRTRSRSPTATAASGDLLLATVHARPAAPSSAPAPAAPGSPRPSARAPGAPAPAPATPAPRSPPPPRNRPRPARRVADRRKQPGATTATGLNSLAAATPIAIRVHMFSRRVRSDRQPRRKNGRRPQHHRRRQHQLHPARQPHPDPAADRQPQHRPHRERGGAARSAPPRPRSAAGSPRAPGSVPRRPPARPSAPAPCRRSGSSPGPTCSISGCIGQV